MSGRVRNSPHGTGRPINLVQNGSFETSTATNTQGGITVGTNATNASLPGWQINNCTSTSTTCGFQFIAQSNYGSKGIWDASNNHYTTFYSTPGVSPDGGNAFVSDASYQTQALYQTINNLNVGDTYVVKFYQASMQQTGYSGSYTGSWAAGLATSTSLGTVQYSAGMKPVAGIDRVGAADDELRRHRNEPGVVLLRDGQRRCQPTLPAAGWHFDDRCLHQRAGAGDAQPCGGRFRRSGGSTAQEIARRG